MGLKMDNYSVLQGKPTFGELLAKLMEIQAGLKQNLNNLHQKLELLTSKPDFQNGLLDLNGIAQTRANELEIEVKKLREDIHNISDLLGLNVEKNNVGKS